MAINIVEKTRTRLRGWRGQYRRVATRAGLTYSWLTKFSCGEKGTRPSFDLIQRLTTALDRLETEGRAGNHASNVRGRKPLAKPHRKATACRAPARKRT